MLPVKSESLDTSSLGTPARQGWLAFAGVGSLATLMVFLRMHAFDLPMESDECNYAYIGARLLAGDRLYIDVWDHQPFGVFALFAGAISLFGDAPIVFRWLACTFSAGSLVLVYAIARRCTTPLFGLAAALLFSLASSDPRTGGEGCNREIFMNTLILATWYAALKSRDANGGRRVLVSGFLLGLASLLKTVVAVHWITLACWLVFEASRDDLIGRKLREVCRTILLFSAGPFALWLLSVVYFFATGRFSEFVDAVFLFNMSYSGQDDPFLYRFLTFFSPPRHPFLFESALSLWIGLVVALCWFGYETFIRYRRNSALILALSIAGFVSICLPGKFWPHYYFLLIPTACIAVPVALYFAAKTVALHLPTYTKQVSIAAAILLAGSIIGLAVTETRHYLMQSPYGITFKRYNSRDFWARAQGENMEQATNPDDSIFVYSNDACIYYYANRKAASRYTMATGVYQGYAGIEERRKILLDELRENLPRAILVTYDNENFPGWEDFLREYYTEPVGWDFGDRHGRPIMFVVARKDAPIEEINWDWDRSEVGGW